MREMQVPPIRFAAVRMTTRPGFAPCCIRYILLNIFWKFSAIAGSGVPDWLPPARTPHKNNGVCDNAVIRNCGNVKRLPLVSRARPVSAETTRSRCKCQDAYYLGHTWPKVRLRKTRLPKVHRREADFFFHSFSHRALWMCGGVGAVPVLRT
jgi:hypothetical protein